MRRLRFALLWVGFLTMLPFGPSSTNLAQAQQELFSEVIVYSNGRPASGRRVSLEFVGGFLPGGFSKSEHTNRDGVARIAHTASGSARVYVDGNFSDHRTTGTAPGRFIVYLTR